MGYIKDEIPETMMVKGDWNIGAYVYKAPKLLDEFTAYLKEKKLLGSLCFGCGKVIVPPRAICGRCHMPMEGRRVVSNWGTVTSYIVSPPVEKGKLAMFGIDAVESGLVKEGDVLVPAFVRFDGSDSNVGTEVLNAKPEEVYVGMRVQAIWSEPTEGKLSDLVGVGPVEK